MLPDSYESDRNCFDSGSAATLLVATLAKLPFGQLEVVTDQQLAEFFNSVAWPLWSPLLHHPPGLDSMIAGTCVSCLAGTPWKKKYHGFPLICLLSHVFPLIYHCFPVIVFSVPLTWSYLAKTQRKSERERSPFLTVISCIGIVPIFAG